MKVEFLDEQDAPANRSGMSREAREKLELLTNLPDGKVAKIAVEPAVQRGFKASLTRIATINNLAIEVWSEASHVYVKRASAPADRSDAGS